MNKEKLYDDYLVRNKNTFVKFSSIELKSKDSKLVFWGTDTEGHDIWVKIELMHNALGSYLMCEEEFTIEELKLFDSKVYYEIYIRPQGYNKNVNLYDWL